MTRSSRPLFRADHVGSLLRPEALKEAFRDVRERRISPERFREVLEASIRAAVAMQESVGLQAITDGEFRRGSWFFGFVQAVEGLTTRDSLFDFQDGEGHRVAYQTAYVDGKLKRTRGIATEEFRFVQALTRRTPKITLPAPSLVHFFRGDESVDRDVYPDLNDFWADLVGVYREEIRALGALGCTYVQLDEVACAVLCDPGARAAVARRGMNADDLLARYIAAINAIVAERPAGMTIAVHLCRGNYKGHWMAQGGYEPVAARLFNETDADVFFLEYDTERAGGFEPLRHVPHDKAVVLGIVSSKAPRLEPLDDLVRRVEGAARYIPLERLGVSPQCGFASSVGGNPLTEDEERAKLARVVELAGRVWGS